MPSMTMVFDVADKTALAKLKTDDKVIFIAGNTNGRLTATNIALAEWVFAQLSAGMRIYIFGNVLNRIVVLHRRSSEQRRPFSEE